MASVLEPTKRGKPQKAESEVQQIECNEQVPENQSENDKKITKRIHRLQKLLNDIQHLKARNDQRKPLQANQKAKVGREVQYQNELNQLLELKMQSRPLHEKCLSLDRLQLLEQANEEEIYKLQEEYDREQTSRIRKLLKKLEEIEELKEQSHRGHALVPNQVAKINKELIYANELNEIKRHEENECKCLGVTIKILWEQIFQSYNRLLEIGSLRRQQKKGVVLTKTQLELIDSEEVFLRTIKVFGKMYEREIINDFKRKSQKALQQQIEEFFKQQKRERAGQKQTGEQVLRAEQPEIKGEEVEMKRQEKVQKHGGNALWKIKTEEGQETEFDEVGDIISTKDIKKIYEEMKCYKE